MKRLAALLATTILLTTGRSRAADWPIALGTEEGTPDQPFRPIGFVQIVGEGSSGARVSGLESKALSRFNGARPTFNSVGDSDSSLGLYVRRARFGLRGSVPKTNQGITYFITTEFGTVALNRGTTARLVDGSITFSLIPGARVRVGQFKLPTMDETVEANPISAEFINLSNVALGLMLENKVEKGAYVGGAYGFRDVGVQVFDTFQRRNIALAYAFMVSNGRFGGVDDDNYKDVTARVTASWVFSGKPSDPHRQELSLFAWGQHGSRAFGERRYERVREGIGVHLEKEPIRVRAELVYGSGMLVLGPNPPFAGEPIAVAPEGRALGGYVQARVRLFGRLLVALRYDQLHRQLDQGPALRVLRTLTPALEWDFTPRAKLMLNYEKRWLGAPHANADAQRIVETVADRVLLQATVTF